MLAASYCLGRQFLRRCSASQVSVRKPVDDLCKTPNESVYNVGIMLEIPGRPRLRRGRYLGERYPLPVYGRKLERVHMQSLQ
jgi:hypothetical protein